MLERIGALLAHLCLTYRKTVLALLLAVSAFALLQLPKMRFDASVDVWFLHDDPEFRVYRETTEEYGNDEIIIVGFTAPDVFAPDSLERIDRLTRRLEEVPEIEKVFSLTNIEAVRGDDGLLDVSPLVEFPLDPADIPAIREKAMSTDLYRGNVVNTDGTYTAILARVERRPGKIAHKIAALAATKQILALEDDSVQFALAGSVPREIAFLVMSEKDTLVVGAVLTIVLNIVLWLAFRYTPAVLLMGATVLTATLWCLGALFFAGRPFTPVCEALTPLMLAIGIADGMHIVTEYQQRCWRGQEKWSALRETYRDLFGPCLLTSLTTVIGMFSLCVSRVRAVKEFGFFAGLGVAGAFVLSMTLVPVVLSYLPAPREHARRKSINRGWARVLHGLERMVRRRSGFVLALWALLGVCGVVGVSFIHSDSGALRSYRDGHPFKRDTRQVESSLSGASTVDIVIDTGRADGLKDPAVLRQFAELQMFLDKHPLVSANHSIVEAFKNIRRAFFDEDPAQYRLPETFEEAAQYLLLYEMQAPDGDIYEYTTYDYRSGRVTARISSESSTQAEHLVRDIHTFVADHFPPEMTVHVTGSAVMYGLMDGYLVESLLMGFGLALVCIWIILMLETHSVSLGTLAMLPNVTPIFIVLGAMGWLGIPLDASTALVASIAIGLAVDDTMHYVGHLQHLLSEGYDLTGAIAHTTPDLGRVLTLTSATLALGFLSMLAADYTGVARFGMLSAMTAVLALPADLTMLPALLHVYAYLRKPDWHVGTIQIPKEPPVLEGTHLPPRRRARGPVLEPGSLDS